MPPPLRGCWVSEGGATCPPPLGCGSVVWGSGSGVWFGGGFGLGSGVWGGTNDSRGAKEPPPASTLLPPLDLNCLVFCSCEFLLYLRAVVYGPLWLIFL